MNQKPAPTEDNRKLVGPFAIVIDLALAAVFFVCMTKVLFDHTPDFSDDHKWIAAGYCSLCLTGIFWLTLQMFRVTLMDQWRRKKAGVQS